MTEPRNTINVPVAGSNRFEQDVVMAISRLKASVMSPDGSPSFANLLLTDLDASKLAGTDADKSFQSINVGDSIALTGTTLDTIQDIRATATPTFAGLTLTGLSGVLQATAGVVSGSATLDDVPDGTSYERVAANQLSSGIYIDATTAVKGIASFDSDSFSVADGHVSLAAGGGLSHNDLGSIQGGTAAEYYHLTETEHGYVSGANAQSVLTTASPTFAGLTVATGLLHTDNTAGNRQVIIGGTTPYPGASLFIDMPESTRNPTVLVCGYGVRAPFFVGRQASGTKAVPTATSNGRRIFSLGGGGHDGADWTSSMAQIRMVTAQEWGEGKNGTFMDFYTTPIDSDTMLERMRITDDGKVGIGTSSPNELLEVNGKIRALTAFNLNGTDGVSDSGDGVPTALTLSGGIVTSVTKNDWLDQSVKTAASPTFAGLTSALGRINARPTSDTGLVEAIRFGRTGSDIRFHSIYQSCSSAVNSYLEFRIHDGGASLYTTQNTVLTLYGSTPMAYVSGICRAAGIVRSDTNFNVSGTDGITATDTVITALQDNAGQLQYKSKTITFTGGIRTATGAESGWTDVPSA